MAERAAKEGEASTSANNFGNNDSKSAPVPTAQIFGRGVTEGKTRPLVTPLVLPSVFEPSVGSPASPASPSSPSADRTDNRSLGADMCVEEERLKTYDKWPLTFLSPETLARNGFYYLGRGDEVRCAFCKVEIMRWEDGDDPAKDHKRWAPQCPFLRKQTITDSSGPVSTTPIPGMDECGVHAAPTGAVRMTGPVHPKYASEAARLRTFAEWPRSMKQKPEQLAEAGFYYTGQGDKTKCFFCDGGLKDWENDDVPWEQHARWFDRCAYVQLVKGRDYVQKVISEAAAISEAAENEKQPQSEPAAATSAPPEEEAPLDDAKVCKICYAEERNVVFVPCGHVVACAKCALATDKCPMCRRTFTSAVRLYYS